MIYASGQNIDRLVSIYRATKKMGKILVVDLYVAYVLETINKYFDQAMDDSLKAHYNN